MTYKERLKEINLTTLEQRRERDLTTLHKFDEVSRHDLLSTTRTEGGERGRKLIEELV